MGLFRVPRWVGMIEIFGSQSHRSNPQDHWPNGISVAALYNTGIRLLVIRHSSHVFSFRPLPARGPRASWVEMEQ